MSSVIDKFKQLTARLIGVVAGTPSSDALQGTVQQRRNKALAQFALAVVFILIAVWQSYLFGAFGNLLIIGVVLYCVPFIIQGIKLWKSVTPMSKDAKASKSVTSLARGANSRISTTSPVKSAKAEKSATVTAKGAKEGEPIALILRELQQQGWSIESHLPIPTLGTVDAFLRSPKNNYFIVNIKSDPGEVFFDEGVLKRREGRNIYDFEQDFLKIAMEQALAVQEIKQLRFVTPILCFTKATLSIETVNNKARDVYVVKQESLTRKLVRLDH